MIKKILLGMSVVLVSGVGSFASSDKSMSPDRKAVIKNIKNTVDKCQSMIKKVSGDEKLFKKNPFSMLKKAGYWKQYKKLMKQLPYKKYNDDIKYLRTNSATVLSQYTNAIKKANNVAKKQKNISKGLDKYHKECNKIIGSINMQIIKRKKLIAMKMK